jgi:hypothetical protein
MLVNFFSFFVCFPPEPFSCDAKAFRPTESCLHDNIEPGQPRPFGSRLNLKSASQMCKFEIKDSAIRTESDSA